MDVWVLMNGTYKSSIHHGSACFEYEDKKILSELSEEDLKTIKEIFHDKRLVKDSPSCGFRKKIAIVLNDGTRTYSITCDICQII